ncbi:MAG: hypothetical protein ACI9YL_001331 [Luteibaculaceae bacterium]|jgi:hypothetical protein
MRPILHFFGKFFLWLLTILIAITLIGPFFMEKMERNYGDDFRSADIPIAPNTEWNIYSDSLVQHQRIWTSFNNKKYVLKYGFWQAEIQESKQLNRGIGRNINKKAYWGYIYQKLVNNDSIFLHRIIQKLDRIQQQEKASPLAFANLVVTFIQDIPYTLVVSSSCDRIGDKDLQKQVNNGMPCAGGVPYGIYSPVQFLSTLEGDCDTRSVLLFALLRHYGYEVSVLVSNQYRHAILGINLPGYGYQKSFRGITYKAWETTAYGFRVGELSPNINNMDFWHVVLIS